MANRRKKVIQERQTRKLLGGEQKKGARKEGPQQRVVHASEQHYRERKSTLKTNQMYARTGGKKRVSRKRWLPFTTEGPGGGS